MYYSGLNICSSSGVAAPSAVPNVEVSHCAGCESLSRAGQSHVFGPCLVRLTGSLVRLDLQVLKELSSKMSLTDIICSKSAGGFGATPLMTVWLPRGAAAAAAAAAQCSSIISSEAR